MCCWSSEWISYLHSTSRNPHNIMFLCFDCCLCVICYPDCYIISLWRSRCAVSASCALFVISVKPRQWRMSSGWHTPFPIRPHGSVRSSTILSLECKQRQRWALCNLKPQANSVECHLLCYFFADSKNHSGLRWEVGCKWVEGRYLLLSYSSKLQGELRKTSGEQQGTMWYWVTLSWSS